MLNLHSNKNLDWPDFDKYAYKDMIYESSFFSEDIIVSNTLKVSLLALASNGIFIFMLSKSNNTNQITKDISSFISKFYLPPTGVFIFVRTYSSDLFLNEKHELIHIDFMQDCFECLYENTLRPLVDLLYIDFKSTADMLCKPTAPSEYLDDNGNSITVDDSGELSYIAPLIPQSVIRRVYDKLEDCLKFSDENGIMIDTNGQRYKRSNTKTKLFSYSYREDWYPIADDDPERFLILTVFGGIIGLHKYRTGEISQGLLYSITFGGFGIFYIFDILSILTGSYFVTTTEYIESDNGKLKMVKSKIFLDKLSKPVIGIIGLIISLGIAYISIRFGFMRILRAINEGLSMLIGNYATMSLELLQ